MSFTEDHSLFLDDFGVDATLVCTAVGDLPYDPAPYAPVAVKVIFDNAYVDAFGVASLAPVALLRTEDTGSAAYGATLTVAGVDYRVTAVEPDGTGMTRLRLERS